MDEYTAQTSSSATTPKTPESSDLPVAKSLRAKGGLFVYVVLPAVLIILYAIYINRAMPRANPYEWGDFGTLSMDVMRAKHFHQLLGQYSARLIRQPGPWHAYLYAATEWGFHDVLGFQSRHAAQVVGVAIHNLLFMFTCLYVLFRILRNKLLMLPAYIWFFALQQSVLQNQLSYMVPHNMSVAALANLLLCAAVICAGQFWPLPWFCLSAVALVHLHAFNVMHVAVATVLVAVCLARRFHRLFEPANRRYTIAAASIVLIGAFPIVYDQLYGSKNLSALIAYSGGAQSASARLPLGPELMRAAHYIPAYYLSPFWGKEKIFSMALARQFYVGTWAAALFWCGLLGSSVLVFWRCRGAIVKVLFGFTLAGALLVAQFAIMNQTLGWEVYGRNLYGYVVALLLACLLIVDTTLLPWVRSRLRGARAYGAAVATALTCFAAFPLVAFPDSAAILKGPASFAFAEEPLKRGVLDFQHWSGTDARLGAMADVVRAQGRPMVLWLDNPVDWPTFYGLATQLFRREDGRACILDPQHWGDVPIMMGRETVCSALPPGGIDVHFSSDFIPFGKTVFDQNTYISVVPRQTGTQYRRPEEIWAPKVDAWQVQDEGNGENRLTVSFSNPNSAAPVSTAYMLLGRSLTRAESCLVRYDREGGSFWLNNDDAGWQGPLLAGRTGTLGNSQCHVRGGASSVTAEGNVLTVTVTVALAPPFADVRNMYLLAVNEAGATSNWASIENFRQALPPMPPVAKSVSPQAGQGRNAVFHFYFSDPNGAADIQYVHMLISASNGADNSCFVQYVPAWKSFWLWPDNGAKFNGGIEPGRDAILENSQCRVIAKDSAVTASGNNLDVKLSVSFKKSYSGPKKVQLFAVDNGGKSSGKTWTQRGTWVIP